jgi:hypothetical protein
MRLAGHPVDDVLHRAPVADQRIGDESPMAPPPEGLGAHDRQRFAGIGAGLQRVQR